jgi:hypothetical protein
MHIDVHIFEGTEGRISTSRYVPSSNIDTPGSSHAPYRVEKEYSALLLSILIAIPCFFVPSCSTWSLSFLSWFFTGDKLLNLGLRIVFFNGRSFVEKVKEYILSEDPKALSNTKVRIFVLNLEVGILCEKGHSDTSVKFFHRLMHSQEIYDDALITRNVLYNADALQLVQTAGKRPKRRHLCPWSSFSETFFCARFFFFERTPHLTCGHFTF